MVHHRLPTDEGVAPSLNTNLKSPQLYWLRLICTRPIHKNPLHQTPSLTIRYNRPSHAVKLAYRMAQKGDAKLFKELGNK